MVDHVIQRVLVSLGKALRNHVSRILDIRVIIGGWSDSEEFSPSSGDVLRWRRRVGGVLGERHPSCFRPTPESKSVEKG